MMGVTAKMVKELRGMTGVGMIDIRKVLIKVEGDVEKAVGFLREDGVAKIAKKNDRIVAKGLINVATVGNVAATAEVDSETDFVSKNEMFQDLVKDIATKVVKNKPATMEGVIAIKTRKGIIESDLIEATIIVGEKIGFCRLGVVEKADNAVFDTYLHMGDRIAVSTVIDGAADEEVAKDVVMHTAVINPHYVNESRIPQEELKHEKTVLTEQALNEDKSANTIEKVVVGRLQEFETEIALVDQPFIRDSDMTVEKFIASRDGEVKSFVRSEVGKGIEKRESNFADGVISQMKG